MNILGQLPIAEYETFVAIPSGVVPVRAHQIIVWVSISVKGLTHLGSEAPRIPAILDTGNNYNFSIQQDHLESWAGLSLPSLQSRGQIRLGTQIIPVVAANVWIHSNLPGQRDALIGEPFQLELSEGIAVYPSGTMNAPRLPLLGLRSIVRNDLVLVYRWREPRSLTLQACLRSTGSANGIDADQEAFHGSRKKIPGRILMKCLWDRSTILKRDLSSERPRPNYARSPGSFKGDRESRPELSRGRHSWRNRDRCAPRDRQ